MAWVAEGYEAGSNWAGKEDNGADNEEAVIMRACGKGKDKEEVGKDGGRRRGGGQM